MAEDDNFALQGRLVGAQALQTNIISWTIIVAIGLVILFLLPFGFSLYSFILNPNKMSMWMVIIIMVVVYRFGKGN